MPKSIKIAPSLDEIRYEDGKIVTEFGKLRITFKLKVELEGEEDIKAVKAWLQQAIAMSSKTHQLEFFMSQCKTTDGQEVGEIEVEEI